MQLQEVKELFAKGTRDFTGITVDGNLYFGGSGRTPSSLGLETVEEDLELEGITVEGALSFRNVTVKGNLNLYGATVKGILSFEGATVEGDLSLQRATVMDILWLKGVTVKGNVNLEGAAVGAVRIDLRGLQGITSGKIKALK